MGFGGGRGLWGADEGLGGDRAFQGVRVDSEGGLMRAACQAFGLREISFSAAHLQGDFGKDGGSDPQPSFETPPCLSFEHLHETSNFGV